VAGTRSISGQSEERLGGPFSVLVRQRRDHARLNVLMKRVRAGSGDEREEAVTAMCRLAFPHAFAEEAVLWPAIRRALPEAEGERLTLEVEKEHQEINELLAALEVTPRGSAERDELVERTLDLLDEDVRDEEDELLPRLQHVSSRRDLQRLGLQWELVQRMSPTRPHPAVSRRPPGNVLSAIPLSLLDRSRDALDRVARRVPGGFRPLSTTASRALAAASAGVERLPTMQSGERPVTHRD
jgi:hypothetical protein